MRVTIDATAALGKTGVGTYGRNLIDSMLGMESDVEFTLPFMGNVSECPQRWRDQARVVGTDRPWVRKMVCGAGSYLECLWPGGWPRDFDVYHSLELFLPKVSEGRSVLTLHGIPSFYSDGTSLKGRFAKRAKQAANQLIAVSQFVKVETVRQTGRSSETVHVIHHGVDHAAASDPRAFSDPRIVSPYIAYVGGLYQNNRNLRGMARAYAGLRRARGARESLALAGQVQTNFAEAFRALVEAAGGEPVTHIGPLAPNDVYGFLRAASLLIYPSYMEGFGLPIVEAMAAGCPVVTSTRGACPEVAGGAAILVDPDDEEAMMNAMVRVIGDNGLRQELKWKGMERAKEFTWERAARQTVDVYGGGAVRHAHQ